MAPPHQSPSMSSSDAPPRPDGADAAGFLIKHDGHTYDIQRFLHNHPGGVNLVQAFQNRSVTQKLAKTHHSPSAMYLLKEYQVGGRRTESRNRNGHRIPAADAGDEDLENLVDWSQPMLRQVASLGERYNEWVAAPVDRELTLFANPLLERLTITPWYVVPIVWVPVICFFLYSGIQHYFAHTQDDASYICMGLSIFLGISLWTFLEYSLHRWVFHMKPSGKSKTLVTLHFALHGLHHKVPFDSRRLVFPPFPAAILVVLIYHIYEAIFPIHIFHLVGSGSMLGYLVYDMIHFYLHNGAPTEGSYLYVMKRYHNQHHFVHHESGFGISNRFWDQIFGTKISLRRLSRALKW